jgi:protein-S-isoprenylcysteine O-methyltransferase Ste14
MNLFEQAIISKNRKKLFWSWYLSGLIIIIALSLATKVYWGLILGPIVVAYAVKEKLLAAYFTSDEEAEDLKQGIIWKYYRLTEEEYNKLKNS